MCTLNLFNVQILHVLSVVLGVPICKLVKNVTRMVCLQNVTDVNRLFLSTCTNMHSLNINVAPLYTPDVNSKQRV